MFFEYYYHYILSRYYNYYDYNARASGEEKKKTYTEMAKFYY